MFIHFKLIILDDLEMHILLNDRTLAAMLIQRRQTGQSPLSYFNLLKVQKACFMLDETDMKINQISSKLGLSDPYYFSRMFTKVMGLSPKEYRNQKKG